MFKALCDYYDNLLENDEKIPPVSLAYTSISFLITINSAGTITDIFDARADAESGGKSKVTKKILLPVMSDKNGSGCFPDFLCGSLEYLTGYFAASRKTKESEKEKEDKESLEKSKQKYLSCRKLHLQLLSYVDTPEAIALRNYFDPETTPFLRCEDNVRKKIMTAAKEKGNIAFRFLESGYPISFDNQQNEKLFESWREHYEQKCIDNSSTGLCLITGKNQAIANMSFRITGLANGQTSGSRMTGSNDAAFFHYGKKDTSGNHPISAVSMRKSELALDYMNRNRQYIRLGITDGTNPQYVKIFYWATGKNRQAAEDLFEICLQGISKKEENFEIIKSDLINAMAQIAAGKTVSFLKNEISPDINFYLLGLEGNSGRGVLSFLYHNSLGGFAENISKHYKRAEIPLSKENRLLTPYWIIKSVVKDDNDIKINMIKNVLMSVLMGYQYPGDIINRALQRERVNAEDKFGIWRASLLKAYIEKKMEEGMNLEKNDSLEKAKKLGELFAWYEHIQYKAAGNRGSNIKDRFYKKMMETPSLILPTVDKLAAAHYKAIQRSGKSTIFYEMKIASYYSEIGKIPVKLSRDEQCAFVTGYYSQRLEHLNGTKNVETETNQDNE